MARVEAGSLSALNLLAANPPRYPVNPTEEPREPLTLYISRVPGTRDVILSTLKPQRKNVTFEDVANALYYVHLDLPSDSLLLAAPPTTTSAGAQAGNNNNNTTSSRDRSNSSAASIARKPVPSAGGAAPATTRAVFDTPLPPVPVSASAPPPQQPLPPQESSSPPRVPQPWVPPGFHLDESHSFEAVPPTHELPIPPPPPPSHPALAAASTLPIRNRPPPNPAPYSAPNVHAPIPRKPVGPRPLGGNNSGGSSESVPSSRLQDKALPPQPPAFAQQTQAPLQISAPDQSQPLLPPALPSPRQTTPGKFVPFQLTLIRRDPSSNHQWNIGKIASVQAADALPPFLSAAAPERESADPRPDPAAQDQPSIRIHLETSGYAKFREDDAAGVGQQGAFARQVVMAYTKSWTAGIRKAFKRHERSSSDGGKEAEAAVDPGWTAADLEPPNRQRFLRPRNNSLTSTGGASADSRLSSFEGSREGGAGGGGGGGGGGGNGARLSREVQRGDDAPGPLITRPGPGLKPKGYTFASPWDGRCEFRTGNGGRSLKCRHVLQSDGTGGGVNPLVIAQSIRDGQGLAAVAAAATSVTGAGGGGGAAGRARAGSLTSALTGAMAVSELRFNLPHGDVFRPPKGEDSYGRFHDHLHHPFHHHHHRRSSSTTDDEYDDGEDGDGGDDNNPEFDLSLGRERAGGGNRGKRAKLGKLIVFDDGFKMLDLVVAANMGIWWVSWEKSF